MAEAAMPSEHGTHSNNVRLGSKNQRFPKSSHLAATSGVGATAGGLPHSACGQSLIRSGRRHDISTRSYRCGGSCLAVASRLAAPRLAAKLPIFLR